LTTGFQSAKVWDKETPLQTVAAERSLSWLWIVFPTGTPSPSWAPAILAFLRLAFLQACFVVPK
jgi:hypothetical protein